MKTLLVDFATDDDKNIIPNPKQGYFKITGELIRCKDCKHYAIAKNGVNGFCNKLSVPFDANEWCSKADAKSEII